jgi:hypothetical protein
VNGGFVNPGSIHNDTDSSEGKKAEENGRKNDHYGKTFGIHLLLIFHSQDSLRI